MTLQIPRILTRAVLVLGPVFGVFGAALIAQAYPGAVAAPFLRFDGAPQPSRIAIPHHPAGGFEIYTVYRPAANGEEVIWTVTVDGAARQVLTTHYLADLSAERYLHLPDVSDCAAPVLRRYAYRSAAGPSPAPDRELRLGTAHGHPSVPAPAFSGEWSTTLAYDRPLAPAERQRVESYLALRYGIPLDQTEPTHYLAPSGIIWNALRAKDYAHRIFGLAADTLSSLHIPSARSSACGGGVVRLSVTAAHDHTFYVIVSDDDGSLAYDNGRFGRHWRVETTGTPPETVSLVVDPTQLHTLLPAGNRWDLLVDTTGSASFTDPLRIPATGESYRLPTRWKDFYFSLAPAQPYDSPEAGDVFHQLTAVPNPAPNGNFHLRAVLARPEALQLRVFDAAGRRVDSWQSERGTSHGMRRTLPGPGLFWLEVTAGDAVRTLKIIAQ